MFFCQNLEHEGSSIVGFCLFADCQEPKSQFCVNCLINPQKHLNCRIDCKPFDKIDIILDLIIYKLDQFQEQADQNFEQFKCETAQFKEIAKNFKEQKFKELLDNIDRVKNWNTKIKQTQFEKEIIDLWLKQGIELINQQEYQRALEKFEKVLKEDSKNYLAKFYQSIIKQKQGVTLFINNMDFLSNVINKNYRSFQLLEDLQIEYPNFQEQALITLKEKLRIKSNNIATLMLQIYSMSKLNKSNTIIQEDIDKNIILYCDTILGLVNNNKKYQQAILSAEQGLIEDIQNSHLNYLKGIVLLQQNQCQNAIVIFDKSIELDPKHVKAYNNKGVSLYDLKQYEQAIICYDKVVSLDPNYVNAYFNKAISLQFLNQIMQAIQNYQIALNMNHPSSHQIQQIINQLRTPLQS